MFTLSPVMQIAAGDLEQELKITRRLLERVPDEHFAWKPHERSMSLGQLAGHIANIPFWQMMTLKETELDLSLVPPPDPESLTNTQALLDDFDARVEALKPVIEAADEAILQRPWTLKRGDQVAFTMPTGVVLRSFCINHMVHHRGQLSVYLRLLDIPLPPIYGPTADESV